MSTTKCAPVITLILLSFVALVLALQPAIAGDAKEAITPDGKTKAVADGETVTLINVATGKTVAKIDIGTRVTSVAFSDDGKKLIVNGKMEFDAATGKKIR